MPDKTAWEEYCEASLDLSDQDNVGEAGSGKALNHVEMN